MKQFYNFIRWNPLFLLFYIVSFAALIINAFTTKSDVVQWFFIIYLIFVTGLGVYASKK